jgi:hypothetical protein
VVVVVVVLMVVVNPLLVALLGRVPLLVPLLGIACDIGITNMRGQTDSPPLSYQ